MAPKSPWNKKPNITNAPKNTATDQVAGPPINYGEVQDEEVEVLKAIYMDDFEDIEVKTAWSKTTDRSFKLKLRSFSDENAFMVLAVHLTATYPKSVPLLETSGLDSFHERTQKRIGNVIRNRPKQLLGEVMIHVIASEIQDALEDAVYAKQQGTLPSLEEERASAEEVATALAKEAEETEARRNQEAQEEEDRVLKQMVNEEVNRRQKRRSTKSGSEPVLMSPITAQSADEMVSFDQPANITVGSDYLHFNTVSIMSQGRGFMLGKPIVSSDSLPPLVAIKRFMIAEKSRADLLGLEKVLDSVRRLRHQNLISLYAYRMDKVDLRTQVTLCTDHADRGCLEDVLSLCGPLQGDKARRFTIQLLEALDECHRNGIAHNTVSVKTIRLTGEASSTPKLANVAYGSILQSESCNTPTKWQAPEGATSSAELVARKTDIWMLGVVVMQMFLGLDVQKHSSPTIVFDRLSLSTVFEEFARKMFTSDVKKRPSAFDLLPAEFLRTDVPALQPSLGIDTRTQRHSMSGIKSPLKRRSRHNSSSLLEPISRYANDFTEIGRLGKGGFGEVVKARNKLDGGVYAVKKISQAPQLDQILSEVMLLNRLNHPYVVRYYSTWVEETFGGVAEEAASTTEETVTEETIEETSDDSDSDGPRYDFGYQSTSGLDFVSSSGYPQIEFGGDSDSGESSSKSDSEHSVATANGSSVLGSTDGSGTESRLRLRNTRSDSRRTQSTLYIQMEYCERHTLRDLVRKGLGEDDAWRFARQITEGLAHVHSHGIVHRDMKPDNVFIDVAGNPKIGDFGLATTSQYQFSDKAINMSGTTGGDMTRSVGTALYVAPELRSGSGTSYNEKVDMYSLGIMFYEMCEPFGTAMERIRALQHLREKNHDLPLVYQQNGAKAAQGTLIMCLVSHKPGERPSSTELLRSNILPLKIEDETIRQALSGLSDASSPYHQKMMSALFSHEQASSSRVKALAWDAKDHSVTDSATRIRLRSVAKLALESVFRRHGAEETQRETLFPRSGYYNDPRVVQLLDASGNLVQLPYDMTLPQARQLAHRDSPVRCVFAFGRVYRDAFSGGPPKASEEVDFDIVGSTHSDSQAMDDAEILKVLDEITDDVPHLVSAGAISFHLNHANVLDAVLEHCRIPSAQQAAVKECISKLGYQSFTWSKIRAELRSPALGLSITTVDDLQQFDFRDIPSKVFEKLWTLFEGAHPRLLSKLESGMRQIQEVLQYARHLDVAKKIYVTPLGSYNAKFYDNGILVQCVHDRRSGRDVIAAGGRYDSLIRSHCPTSSPRSPQGAVGISIGLDRLVGNMLKNTKGSNKTTFVRDATQQRAVDKRCTVLVVAGMTEGIRTAALKILSSLWHSHFSAELAINDRAEDNEDQYQYVVTVRHEASTTVRFRSTADDALETDVPTTSLISHLQQELREREGAKARTIPVLARQTSHHHEPAERKGNVHVLMAQHRSKKSNKYHIVSAAEQRWNEKLDQWKDAPILAVETRDDVLDLVRETRLGDAESWRRVVQGVQLTERQYVQQVQDLLWAWRKKWVEGDGVREACLFNFRTGACVYYDLGL